jgi:hypothetical protein
LTKDCFRTTTLVLYIGSLPTLATWFPCGRGRTLFILGSLPLYCLIIYIDGHILWCTHFLFSYIMARMSHILMRWWWWWWWCLLCNKQTNMLSWIFYSASSLKQCSVDGYVAALKTHYTDSEPTSLCSYSLVLHA